MREARAAGGAGSDAQSLSVQQAELEEGHADIQPIACLAEVGGPRVGVNLERDLGARQQQQAGRLMSRADTTQVAQPMSGFYNGSTLPFITSSGILLLIV